MDTSKGESCKGTADLQVLCETPEYLSICQGGSCRELTCDRTDRHGRPVMPALRPQRAPAKLEMLRCVLCKRACARGCWP